MSCANNIYISYWKHNAALVVKGKRGIVTGDLSYRNDSLLMAHRFVSANYAAVLAVGGHVRVLFNVSGRASQIREPTTNKPGVHIFVQIHYNRPVSMQTHLVTTFA